MPDKNPLMSDADYANLLMAKFELESGNLLAAAALLRKIDNPAARSELNKNFESRLQMLQFSVDEVLATLEELASILEPPTVTDPESIAANLAYKDPAFWELLAPEHGLAFLKWLVEQARWDVVEKVREALELAHGGQLDLTDILEALSEHKEMLLSHSRESALLALATGDYQTVLRQSSYVLSITEDDIDIRLARAEALYELGNLERACKDYLFVAEHADGPAARDAALMTAELYLEMDSYWLAHQMISRIEPGEDSEMLRETIEQRLNGWPTILVRPSDHVIMQDTLQPVSAHVHHAWFAVTVQSTLRIPNNKQVVQSVIGETLLFSNLIGSLYHTEGDPVFALRFIREVSHGQPDAGIRIALLCRVSAEDASKAQRLALSLWNQVRDVLPGARKQFYQYEPVIDADVVQGLLTPFDVQAVTEISRVETPATDEQAYAVSELSIGDATLHRMMHALLEQTTSTMISIQLLPTTLTHRENHLWTQQISGGASDAEPEAESRPFNAVIIGAMDELSTRSRMRDMLHNLQPSCFIMRFLVAVNDPRASFVVQRIGSSFFDMNRSSQTELEGGFNWVSASDAELDIARRNLAQLDLQAWGPVTAPDGLERARWLVNHHEATIALRLPVPDNEGVPGVAPLAIRPIKPPANLPTDGVVLGKSVYRMQGDHVVVRQLNADRRRHSYIVGKTGSGKSTLMQRMILQDIQNGEGVCVVDPHGDLIDEILERIPEHRRDDVVLFDAADYDHPVGLNLLQHENEMQRHMITNEFIGMLIHMYDPHNQGITGPIFQDSVRHAMLTAMEFEGATLVDVVRILTDFSYASKLSDHVQDPVVKNYWKKQMANTSSNHRSEALNYIVSKFSRFVGDRRLRQIIGQSESSIDFRSVMDNRKILLASLSKGKVGPQNAQFLGMLFINSFLFAALSRASMEPDKRSDVYLYVDEFQNFATELFASILSEGRKYGVAAICANQYLNQIPSGVRDAVFGNVGTLISFRMGLADALNLVSELQPGVDVGELINLPQYTTFIKMLQNGDTTQTFTMHTLPESLLPDAAAASQARALSRHKYGKAASVVNREIDRRMSTDEVPPLRILSE